MIRVDEGFIDRPSIARHVEGIGDQWRLAPWINRPSNDSTAEQVEHATAEELAFSSLDAR